MRQEPRPSQEYLLLDYLDRLTRLREGRRAVHVHLSRLKPQNRREHHIRIAANTLEDFARAFEGQMFLLGNGDIALVTKGAELGQLDEAVMRLRYLFTDDPLAQIAADDMGHGRFATLYNLETQFERFHEEVEQLHEEERQRAKRLTQIAQQSGENDGDSRKALTPEQLGQLEKVLQQADLSNVLRRQAICAVAGDSPPKPIFNEVFVSIVELAGQVLPNVNLAANRWLFQHLTQTLDRRVLRMLAKADDSSLHTSFSINVNVATLLAPEFLEFDASLRMGSRGTLVVELQMVDIFSDFSNFVFARDFVKEKGYRVCLDGVHYDMLPFIDRQKMGIDLIKVTSGPVFEGDGPSAKKAEVAREIERCGRARVILTRCDNKTMIKSGQEMGISMFQGRFLDQVLQHEQRRKSPPPTPKAAITRRSR